MRLSCLSERTASPYGARLLPDLPLCVIDFSDPGHVVQHDRMVELVERMPTLYEKLVVARICREQTIIQRQIEATDRQIDRLVYELYGLTEEEIKVVEGK
jgi:hypothetical protein